MVGKRYIVRDTRDYLFCSNDALIYTAIKITTVVKIYFFIYPLKVFKFNNVKVNIRQII